MSSVNKVILIGNLGKDPEMRYMPSGEAIANFSVATSENWTDKASGDKKEQTEWHRRRVLRPHRRGRRAVRQEGLEDLRRGPPADPQVAGTRKARTATRPKSAAT